jgi:methyl-accepting chemotaxis protein
MLLSGGGFYAFRTFAEKYSETVTENVKNKAFDLGEKIGTQFYERYGDIQAFALNPVVKDLNASKLPELLDEYVKLYGIYDVILVVDKNGRFIASNSVDSNGKKINIDALRGVNYGSAAWFDSSYREKFTEDKSKNFAGTYFDDIHLDPIYDLAYGVKHTGTGFSAVIKNERGEKVGVITNRANNRWFETEMANTYEIMKKAGHDNVEITIANKEGRAISYLAPKLTNNKIEFNVDYEKTLFHENVFANHKPAGEHMAKHETGALVSRNVSDTSDDLVGFDFVDSPKWIDSIGWTVVVNEDAKAAFEAATLSEKNYYILSGIFLFISISLAVWFGIVISKSINHVSNYLSRNSAEVSDASVKIAAQSTELSEASTEQAAAIQQTVAAVDEISAMVDKNSDAANKSKEVSAQSREAALRGRQTVENMIQAIGEISSSNEEISYQMEQSNRQLNDITKLINDIGSKTKVINEIVFQTKLLSFNASVEAARAGEYGKGFAVVAEEVGNLAQMSGNAAKEITEMLEQSIRQVENIVADTKSKVEKLMNTSKEKVSYGADTAKECNVALDEILTNVSSVDSLVSEIAIASNEQSTGIREISKAVGQMEEVTQQNSSVAQASSAAAEQLSSQSSELNQIVIDLVHLVNGQNAQLQQNESKPQPKSSRIDQRSAEKTNILKFSKNKPAPSEKEFEPSFKKASGGESVPSSDDAGFES